MAKIYGLFGSMTGKLADTVMSVRNGEQIARKYQPVVFNPSTPAQIAQRAKLKLLSQMSAVMAPVIAIRREGSVSSRNLFTKKNFPLVNYSSETASVDIASIQLTSSVVGLGTVELARVADGVLAYIVTSEAPTDVDRVVYSLFEKGSDNKLRFVGSLVATSEGATADWQVKFPLRETECVVLAYAVRDNTEAARATFGNMQTVTAEEIAKLLVTRTLTETDVTLTETRGYQLTAGPAPTQSVSPAPADGNRSSKKK